MANLTGPRVLVVDDEPDLRALLRTYLSRLGCQAIDAASGGEAWIQITNAEAPFDAFLIDLTLPDMSGKDLARRILSVQPGAKVILTSGYREEAGWPDLPGATFLQKPFNPAQLAAEIAQKEKAEAPAPALKTTLNLDPLIAPRVELADGGPSPATGAAVRP